jgi:hypothetical protein
MRKMIAGVMLVSVALLGVPVTASASTATAKTVCHRQNVKGHRVQCERYRRTHKLHRVSLALAKDITGKRQTAYARYGDTTYVFAINGKRYSS